MRRRIRNFRHCPGKGHGTGGRKHEIDLPGDGLSHFYKHNRMTRFAWREDGTQNSLSSSLGRYASLYRHHALVYERYRDEERCTATQLATVYALYIDGLSLQEYARREGKSPQAISDRINGLASKAPEFHRWWRTVNLGHQRGGPGSRSAASRRRRGHGLSGAWGTSEDASP